MQGQRVGERNREKGLGLVLTGDGKGKTTAALGLVLRTLGHGERVAVLQFIKGGWEPGEARALARFGDDLHWHALGEGFTWETQDRERDRQTVQAAWQPALRYLAAVSYTPPTLPHHRTVITSVVSSHHKQKPKKTHPRVKASTEETTPLFVGRVRREQEKGPEAQDGPAGQIDLRTTPEKLGGTLPKPKVGHPKPKVGQPKPNVRKPKV